MTPAFDVAEHSPRLVGTTSEYYVDPGAHLTAGRSPVAGDLLACICQAELDKYSHLWEHKAWRFSVKRP